MARQGEGTHSLDMTQIDGDADLAALQADPRFAALLPSRTIRAAVRRTVQVIREWDGEAANDQFGWIARVIGDVDRDGVPDIVTSAPTKESAARRPAASTSTRRRPASCCGASTAAR